MLPNYYQKQEKPLFKDLEWNFPERKSNSISVIGGNAQNFSTVIKTAEYLTSTFPIQTVKTVLPESLRKKVPFPLDFAPSTNSGSFDKTSMLDTLFSATDYNLIIGDLSKNSITSTAIEHAINSSSTPAVIARDSVDVIASAISDLIEHPNLTIIASMPQLQKLFRTLYYPKMLLLSQPLLPVIETLHKFSLSYPATILTLHQDQIIVASSGKITSTPLEKTSYSPITLWSGTLAANVTAYNLWNPNRPLEATTAAILK